MPNGGYQMMPNGGYQMMPNGGYQMMPTGGYQMMPTGGYPMMPNGGYPMMPNGDYPMRPNGDYPMRPNGDYPMRPSSNSTNSVVHSQQPTMQVDIPHVQQPTMQVDILHVQQPTCDEDLKKFEGLTNMMNTTSLNTKSYGSKSNNCANAIVKLENTSTSKYLATYYDDSKHEVSHSDISPSVLKTFNIVNTHNSSLPGTLSNGIIYTRTSSKNCVSIETQLHACLDYAKTHGIKLVEQTYAYLEDNGVSSRFMNNLNYELGFWKDSFKSGTHLIVYSVDRLTRNYERGEKFIMEMLNKGIHIHFVFDNIVLSQMNMMEIKKVRELMKQSQAFSDQTSLRVNATLKRLRNEKNYISNNTKYGFKRDLIGNKYQIVNDPAEQLTIQQIRTIYNSINSTYKAQYIMSTARKIFLLQQKLKDQNIVNRRGKQFSRNSLKLIIS